MAAPTATLYAPGVEALRLDRILVAAHAAGVRVAVETDAAAVAKVRELSPFGTAPVLVLPGGQPVARTHAIMRALAGLREDACLQGWGAFDEAAVEQWLGWTFFDLEPLAMVLTVPAVRAALAPGELAAAEASARSKAGPVLAQLDSHLATRTFLVGQRLTLADVAAAVVAGAVWDAPGLSAHTHAGLPHVARWLLTCRNQPCFQALAAGAGAASGGAASAPPAAPAARAAPSASEHAGAGGGGGHGLPTSLTAKVTVLPGAKFVRARTRVADMLHAGAALIGTSVTVCGWARTIREAGAGALQFIALNDGSCFDSLQVLAERGVAAGFEAVTGCGGTGASFRITGNVVKSPAKGQEVELVATELVLLGPVQDPVRARLGAHDGRARGRVGGLAPAQSDALLSTWAALMYSRVAPPPPPYPHRRPTR